MRADRATATASGRGVQDGRRAVSEASAYDIARVAELRQIASSGNVLSAMAGDAGSDVDGASTPSVSAAGVSVGVDGLGLAATGLPLASATQGASESTASRAASLEIEVLAALDRGEAPTNPEEAAVRRFWRLRYVIPAVCGMALGGSSLGGVWKVASVVLAPELAPIAELLVPVLAVVGAVFLCMFIAKACLQPRAACADVQDPRPIGALISAGTMATMVLGGVLHGQSAEAFGADSWGAEAGVVVWRCGLWVHLCLMTNYIVQRAYQTWSGSAADWQAITPTLFVVFVGIGAGAASAGTTLPVEQWEVDLSLYVALGWLVPLLVLVFCRLQQWSPLTGVMVDCARGSMPIFMAPSSLCLVAWLSTAAADADYARQHWLTHALAAAAALTAVYVWAHARVLLWELRPSPAWASWTFPCDITAVAAMKYAALYPDSGVLRVVAWVLFVAAATVVGFTLTCFVLWAFTGKLWAPYALFGEHHCDRGPGKPTVCWKLRPDTWRARLDAAGAKLPEVHDLGVDGARYTLAVELMGVASRHKRTRSADDASFRLVQRKFAPVGRTTFAVQQHAPR